MNLRFNNMLWFSGFIVDLGLILWVLSLFPNSLEYMYIFSTAAGSPITDLKLLQFGFGVMGAVTVGWGLVLMFFSQLSSTEDWRLAKRFLMISMFSWYALDSIISVVSTFYFNVISNSVLLVIGWFVITRHSTDELNDTEF